jgi:hypothetical protein
MFYDDPNDDPRVQGIQTILARELSREMWFEDGSAEYFAAEARYFETFDAALESADVRRAAESLWPADESAHVPADDAADRPLPAPRLWFEPPAAGSRDYQPAPQPAPQAEMVGLTETPAPAARAERMRLREAADDGVVVYIGGCTPSNFRIRA